MFTSRVKQLRTISLVVAALVLVGATSTSAASKIGGNQIKKNAIASKQIKNNSVQGKDIKDGNVGSADIQDGGVGSADVQDGAIGSADIQDGAVGSADIQNGGVGSADLANGAVTADKLAPGAVAFPSTFWNPSVRNQTAGAVSKLQTGPAGQPLGQGSLLLSTSGPTDTAAFQDPIDFLGVQLANITAVRYASFNGDATPLVRPSLRIEIDPHLVADSDPGGGFEFTTLIYEPAPGATGWVTHANAQLDPLWYLTGDEGVTTGCNQATKCTLAEVLTALDTNVDDDTAAPAINFGIYFGLGSGVTAPTVTAVDAFVFNGFTFNFEPTAVFMTPPA